MYIVLQSLIHFIAYTFPFPFSFAVLYSHDIICLLLCAVYIQSSSKSLGTSLNALSSSSESPPKISSISSSSSSFAFSLFCFTGGEPAMLCMCVRVGYVNRLYCRRQQPRKRGEKKNGELTKIVDFKRSNASTHKLPHPSLIHKSPQFAAKKEEGIQSDCIHRYWFTLLRLGITAYGCFVCMWLTRLRLCRYAHGQSIQGN